MKNCKTYLLWFAAGQVVQLVLSIIGKAWRMDHPILFCAAAGLIVAVLIGAGMYVANQENNPTYDDLKKEGTISGEHVR